MSRETLAALLSRTGMDERDFNLARNTPLIATMDDAQAMMLLGDARAQNFTRGHILFVQDEPADRFYCLLDGWVKISRLSPSGEESVIHVFARGETFAEAAMFEEGTFPVTAEVVDDCRVLAIPARSFIETLKRNPTLALNILAAMSRHLRALVSQLEQLTTKSSTQRLADLLVRMAGCESGPTEFRLPLDKSLIAGRLGMQPETLSRSLFKLRAIGVETERERIAIADVARLRHFAASNGRDV